MTQAQQPVSVEEIRRAVENLRVAEARASRQLARSVGLRGMERAVVLRILELGENERCATPTELAHYLAASTAAITQVIDRLVAAGIVERRRSDIDRRQVTVHLIVGHGDPRLFDPLGEPLREAVEALDKNERGIVLRFLSDVCSLLPAPHRSAR